MAKLVAKTLQNVAIDLLKEEFDAIAEDCSLLNVSVTGDTSLTLTIDTDLVITYNYTSGSTGSFSSVYNYFNGNSINSRSSSVSMGTNDPFRVIYSESFIYCHIKGGSGLPWFIFEKIGNNKFAFANVSNAMEPYCPMKAMNNTSIERFPKLTYTVGIDTIDFVPTSILCMSYTKVLEDPHLYLCSNTGLPTTTPDKILTINNHDYYTLTPNLLIPIDDE